MTALRELAERWRPYCAETEAMADELLQILDAEGDAGAVDFVCPGYLAAISDAFHYLKDGDRDFQARKLDALHTILASTPLYTHPESVRSGVVSDERVERFKAAFAEHSAVSPEYDECIRAALEHFAKSLPAVDGGDKRK